MNFRSYDFQLLIKWLQIGLQYIFFLVFKSCRVWRLNFMLNWLLLMLDLFKIIIYVDQPLLLFNSGLRYFRVWTFINVIDPDDSLLKLFRIFLSSVIWVSVDKRLNGRALDFLGDDLLKPLLLLEYQGRVSKLMERGFQLFGHDGVVFIRDWSFSIVINVRDLLGLSHVRLFVFGR